MNIDIKTDRDFAVALDDMRRKYGEDFELLNGFHDSQLNFSDFIDGFVDKNVADATIDGNANAHYKDVCSLLNERGKSEDKLFAYNKVFLELKQKWGLKVAREWLEAEYSGAFYMHDAPSCSMKPYCYAYDLTRLATEGLFFLQDYNNQPPKHLTTFLDDVIEFISFFANRTSGATGLPNLLLWTYYFWKKDCEEGYYLRDPDYYIRQCFSKFIYRINQPFLRIDQSAFVNVSLFDREYLTAMFGGVIFPDGTMAIDYIEELIEHEKIFAETMSEIRTENMFTFPVVTTSLLYKDGKFVDEEFARWASDWNSVWNESNFFTSDDVGTLSSCCRLLSRKDKLKGFINSIGGTALSIGSVKVNTINLMRIAYESNKEEQKFLSILQKRTDLCCKVLDRIRYIITRNIEKGLLPCYCDGGIEMDKQYCTVGVA